jgi:hypothetical protein
MPNRILRDWTDSEKINELSVHAERFFTRLIMKVDDYGRFTANVKMLKPMLFPLLIDQIREADLSRWMTECQKAGLVVIYEVNLKQVLQICNFKQALRQKIEKYPPPEALKGNATQMHSRCIADASLKPEEKPETRIRNPETGNRKPEKKNTRKREVIPFIPPELFEFENYFLENGFPKELAYRAFKGYSEADWHDSHGNPVRNWKQKCQYVWFRPENLENKNQKKSVDGKSFNKAQQASDSNKSLLQKSLDGTLGS